MAGMEPVQPPNPLTDYGLQKLEPAKSDPKISQHQAVQLFIKSSMLKQLLTTVKKMSNLFSKK